MAPERAGNADVAVSPSLEQVGGCWLLICLQMFCLKPPQIAPFPIFVFSLQELGELESWNHTVIKVGEDLQGG